MDKLVFATMQDPREFFARVDDDMTLQEAAELHDLAGALGIEPDEDEHVFELDLAGVL